MLSPHWYPGVQISKFRKGKMVERSGKFGVRGGGLCCGTVRQADSYCRVLKSMAHDGGYFILETACPGNSEVVN